MTQNPANGPVRFDTILYGASYYHEYMPSERLAEDVRLMREAGVNFIRMGESTWSLWEPEEGQFDASWMDPTLDALHEAGIRVILGTPTYSLPTWLYHRYPEILARPNGGAQSTYGMRQNMNIDHAAYRFHAQRVIEWQVRHFRDHPAVIGWQVDNETASYGATNDDVFVGFVEHLRAKYGDLETLNKAWLMTYWGQNVRHWEHLKRQDVTQSTAYKLEWMRFQQQRVTNFLAWQADLVRRHRRPDQFILQDFSPGLHRDVNENDVARHLDIVGVNPYHGTQNRLDGHLQALNGDFYRSLKGSNYLVTEINAQTMGWSAKQQFPPFDGQARLDVYTHLASGANMVAYWHWATLHSGIETYWKGVLGHDLEPGRFYREMARTANELKRIGPDLVNLDKSAKVAILYSSDALNALDIMPITDGHPVSDVPWEQKRSDYSAHVHGLHRCLFELNVETDFVFPDTKDLSDYDVLIVPALYVAKAEVFDRIIAFAEAGGHVLVTFKSGFADEHSHVRPERQPARLRAAAGVSYQEFSSLEEPVILTGPLFAEVRGEAVHWLEFLEAEGADILARYEHPFFGQWAAITRKSVGSGSITYQGAWLSDQSQRRLMTDVLDMAGVTSVVGLPDGVRLRRGVSGSGKRLIYVLNYSDKQVELTLDLEDGTRLLNDGRVGEQTQLVLEPWDLEIIALD